MGERPVRLKMDQAILNRLTSTALRGVPTKAVDRPILSCLHLKATAKTLTVTGTDTATTSRASASVEAGETGEVATAATVLASLVAQLPPGEVMLSTEDGGLRVKAGQGSWLLRVAAADAFPTIVSPKGTKVDLSAAAVRAGLVDVLQYASDDLSKPALMGCLLVADPEGLRLVACDSVSLATRLLRGETVLAEDETVLPPAKDLSLLLPMLEEVDKFSAVFAKQSVAFQASHNGVGTEAISTLIAKEYPPWANLVKPRLDNQLTVNQTELLAAVRRCALLGGSARVMIMHLDPDTGVRLSLSHNEVGEGSELVGGEYEGEPVAVGFQASRVATVLETLPGEVAVFRQLGERMPVRVTSPDDDDLLMLVMPLLVPKAQK